MSNQPDVYLVRSQYVGEEASTVVVICDEMVVNSGTLYAIRDEKRIAGFKLWVDYTRTTMPENPLSADAMAAIVNGIVVPRV